MGCRAGLPRSYEMAASVSNPHRKHQHERQARPQPRVVTHSKPGSGLFVISHFSFLFCPSKKSESKNEKLESKNEKSRRSNHLPHVVGKRSRPIRQAAELRDRGVVRRTCRAYGTSRIIHRRHPTGYVFRLAGLRIVFRTSNPHLLPPVPDVRHPFSIPCISLGSQGL
jgi:hypothetical protein